MSVLPPTLAPLLPLLVDPPLRATMDKTLRLRASSSGGVGEVRFSWGWASTPNGDLPVFESNRPLVSDEVVVIPRRVGIYELRLYAADDLRVSDPVTFPIFVTAIDHDLHLSDPTPMEFLANVVRDWIRDLPNKERLYALWEGYHTLASRVYAEVARIYLSKSIDTVLPVFGRMQLPLPTRLLLPPVAVSFGAPYRALEGYAVDPTSIHVPGAFYGVTGRLVVFGNETRRILASSKPHSVKNLANIDTLVTTFRLDDPVSSLLTYQDVVIPALWTEDMPNVAHRRISAGDRLRLQLTHPRATANMEARIYGSSLRGAIAGFLGTMPLSDTYMPVVGSVVDPVAVTELAEAFYTLHLDPGTSTYSEIAAQTIRHLTQGRADAFATLSIGVAPHSVLRLSRFDAPPTTIAIPTLASTPQRPVHLLTENTDYVLGSDDRGVYVTLNDTILLDEDDPPDALWAAVCVVEETPWLEELYGLPTGTPLSRVSPRAHGASAYLDALKGIAVALCLGPTVASVEIAASAIAGLPLLRRPSLVRSVTALPSGTTSIVVSPIVNGRAHPDTEEYVLPPSMPPRTWQGRPLAAGDSLPAYFVLGKAVEVSDWVNDPDWCLPFLDTPVRWPNVSAAHAQGWTPGVDPLVWPEGTLQPFREPQKIHTYAVRLDVSVASPNDAPLVWAVLSGLSSLWVHDPTLRQIRPTYAFPLFVVTLPLEDTLSVHDRLTLQPTLVSVSDLSGYETTGRLDLRDPSGLAQHNTSLPPFASLDGVPCTMTPHPPSDGALSYLGCVRLDVHRHTVAAFLVGESITDGTSTGTISAIQALPFGATDRVTETLFVLPNVGTFENEATVAGVTSLAAASVDNASVAEWSSSTPIGPSTRPRMRSRDGVYLLAAQTAWEVYRRHPDLDRVIESGMPHTHPRYVAPTNDRVLPQPRPSLANLSAYQQDDAQEALRVRPLLNPLSDGWRYDDPFEVTTPVGSEGKQTWPLSESRHDDQWRAGHVLRLWNRAAHLHLEEAEIQHVLTVDQTLDDLDLWDDTDPTPAVIVDAVQVYHEETYLAEVYDPRIPRVRALVGEYLGDQTGLGLREVRLPDRALPVDDLYVGYRMRIRNGDGHGQDFWILAYDGATKVATLDRDPGGTLSILSTVELHSERAEDHAWSPSQIREHVAPADPSHLYFQGAVRSGDTVGGSPPCAAHFTASSATVTFSDIANVRPSGLDFASPTPIGTLPFVEGIPAAGDTLHLFPQGADLSDARLAATTFLVTAVLSPTSLSVSPTPAYTSSGSGLLFAIRRESSATYWRDEQGNLVPHLPLSLTPFPAWRLRRP